MKPVSVAHDGSGTRVGSNIRVADSWWRRLRGLLARGPLGQDDGLLLLECGAIHTVGMTYPIDVAFLDAEGIVVRSIPRMMPCRVGRGGPEAVHTLELAAGRLDETGTVPGVRLNWS